MKFHEFAIVLTCGIIVSAIFLSWIGDNKKLPPISDNERWGDLNNADARNRFCQFMGYDVGGLIESGYGREYEPKYAGNPYGYDIICKKTVIESYTYSYEEMKRWMLSIEIKGNRT